VERDRQLYYYRNEEGFEKGELLGCISLTGFNSVSQSELKFVFFFLQIKNQNNF